MQYPHKYKYCQSCYLYKQVQTQEAQLPQRNSASAVHLYLGWLTDCALQ